MNTELLPVVHEKESWMETAAASEMAGVASITTPSASDRRSSSIAASNAPWLMRTLANHVAAGNAASDAKGRRKSWHAMRFEKKRRKGVVTESELLFRSSLVGPMTASPHTECDSNHIRQKRHSWWNVFVNNSRSRRASQDGGKVAKENFHWMRSKSRSVDHGMGSPLDLQTLRSQMDSHLQNIEGDLDADSANESVDKRRSTGPRIKTTIYTVKDRDTLTAVAARFDTTPSELTKLNRLVGPYIFPGQQLLVPATRGPDDTSDQLSSENASSLSTNECDSSITATDTSDATCHDSTTHDASIAVTTDLSFNEKQILDNLRPVSPKCNQSIMAPDRVRTPSSDLEDNIPMSSSMEVNVERFLKINVRHITDGQGVVGGVLLVTPNAVMFDPNVSDPLVIEHGSEAYGVIAPMEFVVNAAIYYDIAHMRVMGHHNTSILANSSANSEHFKPPEIYHPKWAARPDADLTDASDVNSLPMVKDETFPELGTTTEDNESICSCTDIQREGNAFPKAFDRDLVTPTNTVNSDMEVNGQVDDSSLEENLPNGDVHRTESSSATERRSSMLDHHWAIPSKDRQSFETDDPPPTLTEDLSNEAEIMTHLSEPSTPLAIVPAQTSDIADADQVDSSRSCHDSGIDIRSDSGVAPLPTKKQYSDAEIVLSNDWVPPLTIAPTNIATSTSDITSPSSLTQRKKANSVSFSLDSNSEVEATVPPLPKDVTKDEIYDKSDGKKNKMLKRLSYPLSWMETLAGEDKEEDKGIHQQHPSSADAPHSSSSSSSVFSKVFSRRSSVGTFIRQPVETLSGKSGQKSQPTPKLDYRSMVSVDDMPELFASFDKLIPRPARSCEDPPLYLRLRMGKPINKPIPKSTPLMTYGKKKMKPEYWFSVPKNRVDDLYQFFQYWAPNLYGELNENEVKDRGFILVEIDTELWSNETTPSTSRHGSQDGELTELTKESWEVLPMSDEYRRAFYASGLSSLDVDLAPPDLIGTTEILTDHHRESLCRHLPARAEGYVWTLVFSTSQHGFSLNSMYRKMYKLESPILLVIEDTDNNVFGALTSCALQVSDHFYGTGESLLFRFTPEFQVYNWTGENLYFIKGNNESLSIGAGDGKFGLWLDGDLYLGRSETCKTYGNEPLTPKVDFVVKTLECWAFISS